MDMISAFMLHGGLFFTFLVYSNAQVAGNPKFCGPLPVLPMGLSAFFWTAFWYSRTL